MLFFGICFHRQLVKCLEDLMADEFLYLQTSNLYL